MSDKRIFQLSSQTTALSTDAIIVDNSGYGAALQVPVPTLLGRFYGPLDKFTPVNDALFSWVNQGGATVDTTSFAPVVMSCPASAGVHNYHIRTKPIIGSSFTLTAFVSGSNIPANYWLVGIGVRNSGNGKFSALEFGFSNGQYFSVDHYTNPTTFTGIVSSALDAQFWRGAWLRIISDGTTLTYQVSVDGFVFSTWTTETIASFIGTATDVFWGGNHLTNIAGSAALWSWTEV